MWTMDNGHKGGCRSHPPVTTHTYKYNKPKKNKKSPYYYRDFVSQEPATINRLIKLTKCGLRQKSVMRQIFERFPRYALIRSLRERNA